MNNFIFNRITAAEGLAQGPLNPIDIQWIWLTVAIVIGAVLLGLLIWRAVAGWKERSAEKKAEYNISSRISEAQSYKGETESALQAGSETEKEKTE